MKTKFIYTLLLSFIFIACEKNPPVGNIPTDTDKPSNLAERIIKDTAYGADPKQKMDIYLPAGRTTNTKTIVLVHGGAWIGGDKNDLQNFVTLFRKKWPEAAIININYRYANGKNILLNNLLDDMESAMKLYNDNRVNFQVSDKQALFGASAGGHLVLMYAYTNRNKGNIKCVADLFGPSKINDWDLYNNSVIFPYATWFQMITGSTYNEELYKSVSPLEFVKSNAPPTIIFHGTLDVLVPIRHSQQLKAKLDGMKVPNEFIEYFEGHGFSDAKNDDCATRCVIFFKNNMK